MLIYKHQGIISWLMIISVNLIVMIGRLYQKTKYAKEEMYEFQKYALHESLLILLHFNGKTRE